MKKSFALLLFIVSHILIFGQTVTYVTSNEIIANPERGLQKFSITGDDYATISGANNLSIATLNSWKTSADKVTVVYRYFLLDAFLNSDIDPIYLSNIQGDFDNVRSAGFKIITRFSYSNAQGTEAQQPSKSQILAHISQLEPILNENKDIIFSLQAGFIGTWGEWYYTNSTEFGTDGIINEAQWLNRKEIVDAMLEATPLEIPIQVRYAGIKTTMFGNTPLTELTAYQNTPNARIGFYNDAFLNDYGDQGTYSVSGQCENPVGSEEYNYISNETSFLPMTGETNGLNACDNGFRTTGANALDEMNWTNWTTINRDYFTPFWDQVISSNHYEDILKNVGYRFVLNSSVANTNGTNLSLNLDISNVGFARPFKERNLYLIIKNIETNSITTKLINTDIRTWDSSVSISQDFDLGMIGSFQLYLWAPDIDPTLATNPEYSIQFANTNTWEATTGYNDLMQTIDLIKVDIEEVASNGGLSLYPNPVVNVIAISYKDPGRKKIEIRNLAGQLIMEANISNNERLDLSRLTSGMYFIRFADKNSMPVKFIKE